MGQCSKQRNGGETWTPINYSGIQSQIGDPNFSDIDFVDELNGFVVVKDNSSGSYKTTDGGLTWTLDQNEQANMCFKHSVYPITANNWFVGGAGCFQSGMI